MITKSLSNLNSLKIIDESTQKTYYGCNQQWYATEWQRRSGCGPCVVSNIILYLTRSIMGLGQSFNTKRKCLLLMDEIWKYVTPTAQGIPTTKMLYEAVLTYTAAKGLSAEYAFCDVPADHLHRPKLSQVVKFLEGALLKDTPIAFVNLCNGDEENLIRWHWVTIISLERAEAGDKTFVTIIDDGIIEKIDLELWYDTTTLGGGFVYFTVFPIAIQKM